MSQVDVRSRPEGTPSGFTHADAEHLVARLRTTYAGRRTRSIEWRQQQLSALLRMIKEREKELVAALVEDLGRAPFEAWAADLWSTGREIEDMLRNLGSWMKPERRKVPALYRPGRAQIVREPLGVVLVIAPWNYPVQLLLAPLAAALAAGNAVVCKPSEVSSASSAALARILPEYLDPDAVAIVEGGIPETTALLDQRWDHILYTGNGTVGRIVAAAAAKHLTPVTLELGGKSPVIVTKDANLKLAASRVAFSKFLNAGQTCVASDHVYVEREVEQEFLTLLTKEIEQALRHQPSDQQGLRTDHQHRSRRAHQATCSMGTATSSCAVARSTSRRSTSRLPSCVRVAGDAAVMGAEIFGPVLPVLTFDDLTEVTDAISAGDKPLALYLFTGSDETVEHVLGTTSSGGVCVNDAITTPAGPDAALRRRRRQRVRRLQGPLGLRDLHPPQVGLPPAVLGPRPADPRPAVLAVEADARPPVPLSRLTIRTCRTP